MSERFWILRVYHGVRHTFPTRWLEWLMAVLIIVWGGRLLDGHDSFATPSHAWDGLAYWAPDYAWGSIMVLVGAARFGALTINGTFNNTIYSQFSPLVRGMSAGVCGILWLFVELSVASVGTQGSITYAAICTIEFFISVFVLGEAGDNLRAHRHGRRNR
jgi:hypothetical protein